MVIDGEIHLRNIAAAEWFVKTYYQEVIDFFMNPLNIYGYDVLAKILKAALDKTIISLNTLLGTDQEVMDLLRLTDDKDVKCLLNQLHRNVEVKEDKFEYDLHRKNKVRLIDPTVLYKDRLVRSSEISKEIKKMSENAQRKALEGMCVRIVSNSAKRI